MNKKPDSIVAEKIVEKLLEKQLISKNKKDEWIKKLSFGDASSEDWNLLSDFHTKEKGTFS